METYDNPWLLNESIYHADELPIGMVYLITNQKNGKKYVGKKLFWKPKTRMVKGRKKREQVESDWKTYYGSSKTLLEDIERFGKDAFKREILHLCKSKGELSYLEAKEQFDREVLLDDSYYNGIINCRINRKHVGQLVETGR